MTIATVNGFAAIALSVHVPGAGPWWADVTLDGAPELTGQVTIAIGALELSGTVDPGHNGTHALQRRMRVVAGAGGWGTMLRARHYHNDAQIRARTVAEDAAREAGETLGDFAPATERIGIDYVRQAGAASRVLEDVIGGAPWWVGYDGVTRVGARSTSSAAPSAYEVIEHVPDERVVVLAVDDLRAVGIGSVLTRGLDEPQTVRELSIEVEPALFRVRAWCGGESGARGRVAGLLRDIARASARDRLLGHWRYRVVRMSAERVELQSVRRDADLPDVLPISMWPGAPGVHAELAPGAHVLVEFIEGDRRLPIITHFAGKDGTGWVPAELVLGASSTLRLGSENANDGVALSSRVNERLDDIAAALDALCGLTPVPNDGGAALQTAVKAVWAGSAPAGVPTPPADVGSTKVVAE